MRMMAGPSIYRLRCSVLSCPGVLHYRARIFARILQIQLQCRAGEIKKRASERDATHPKAELEAAANHMRLRVS